MFLIFLNLGLVIAMWLIATFILTPIVNKWFAAIWAEEERPMIKRETQERLNELFVDGEVPEEVGLVMASKEQGIEEQEMLALYNAVNAKDLSRIVRHKKEDQVTELFKFLDKLSKINMKGKRGG